MKDEETDEELERIKRKKLREMIRRPSRKQVKTASDKPIEITDATFTEIIQNHLLVVVDCWAPWCGPCRIIAPILEELARDYAGKMLFGKLNVDENQNIAIKYQIMSIPTLLVFKDAKLVDRIVGAMSRKMLEPQITRHL